MMARPDRRHSGATARAFPPRSSRARSARPSGDRAGQRRVRKATVARSVGRRMFHVEHPPPRSPWQTGRTVRIRSRCGVDLPATPESTNLLRPAWDRGGAGPELTPSAPGSGIYLSMAGHPRVENDPARRSTAGRRRDAKGVGCSSDRQRDTDGARPGGAGLPQGVRPSWDVPRGTLRRRHAGRSLGVTASIPASHVGRSTWNTAVRPASSARVRG